MRIEQSFTVATPLDQLWRFVRDPARVAGCIPGCRSIDAIDSSTYRADIEVAFGPIRPSFGIEVRVTEERPPVYAATSIRGEEKGKASRLSATTTFELTAIDAGTTAVTYTADVTVTGKLATYGLGMMRKKAESLASEFASQVQQRASAAA